MSAKLSVTLSEYATNLYERDEEKYDKKIQESILSILKSENTFSPEQKLNIPEAEFAFQVNGSKGEFLFGLRYDGTSKQGEGFELDKAAQQFFDALAPLINNGSAEYYAGLYDEIRAERDKLLKRIKALEGSNDK